MQYIKPPFGPYPNSRIASSTRMSSLTSISGSYGSVSAAGSKFTTYIPRLWSRPWICSAWHIVVFPTPAGPMVTMP